MKYLLFFPAFILMFFGLSQTPGQQVKKYVQECIKQQKLIIPSIENYKESPIGKVIEDTKLIQTHQDILQKTSIISDKIPFNDIETIELLHKDLADNTMMFEHLFRLSSKDQKYFLTVASLNYKKQIIPVYFFFSIDNEKNYASYKNSCLL